jgi:membrane dipeptidase
MLIVDAHLDLAMNAMQLHRDLSLSVHTIRTLESKQPLGYGREQNTVALPEMRRGNVALCFATLLARCTGRPDPLFDHASVAQAYSAAKGHLAYYRALETLEQVRIITAFNELESHMNAWKTWEQNSSQHDSSQRDSDQLGLGQIQPPLGFVISMESADPILHPEQLSEWHAAGVRIIGPAHYGPGRYAGGTGTELGFTPMGLELLEQMERQGVILDLTHLTDKGFWEACEHFNGIVLASHNNCRALVPHQRQFDDTQLEAIIERDGVIGVAFDNWMIRPGWKLLEPSLHVSIAHVVDHIDHICQLAGNADHAAIGSDLDGGFGREQSPRDLDSIVDLQMIPDLLQGRGYTGMDIAKIMHGNWLRLLREAWKTRR